MDRLIDGGIRFREAGPGDAVAVAALHADSWQRHYRGAYADAFLDGEPSGMLDPLWAERLAEPEPKASTILAEAGGELVGLVHTRFDASPTWGALIDNLHVRYAVKRQGIGTRLLRLAARAVERWSPASGLYLWVLEQNTTAQEFYLAQGGTRIEHAEVPPPGGDPGRLNGRPTCLRIAWHAPLRHAFPD